MGYNESKTRSWTRSTPNDGLLFEAEFQRLYDNFIAIVNNGGSAPTKDMEALNTFMVNLQKGQSKFNGLGVSNAADADHDITFATGWVVDSTGIYNLNLPSALTKQIDATWAVGNNAGGLFSGAALTADTFYYPFLIRKTSDGSIEAGFDDNKVATNIPSGYSAYRRLRGAFLTDGSANILGFYQHGDYFLFKTVIKDVDDTTPGTSKTLVTMSVPPDMIGLFTVFVRHTSAVNMRFGNPSEVDAAASSDNQDMSVDSSRDNIHKDILTNSSSQIFHRFDVGTVAAFKMFTKGFFDPAEL
jgi:hypothetical protein